MDKVLGHVFESHLEWVDAKIAKLTNLYNKYTNESRDKREFMKFMFGCGIDSTRTHHIFDACVLSAGGSLDSDRMRDYRNHLEGYVRYWKGSTDLMTRCFSELGPTGKRTSWLDADKERPVWDGALILNYCNKYDISLVDVYYGDRVLDEADLAIMVADPEIQP